VGFAIHHQEFATTVILACRIDAIIFNNLLVLIRRANLQQYVIAQQFLATFKGAIKIVDP